MNCLFLITGLPGETSSDFLQTADWLATNAEAIAFVEPYAFQLRRDTELCGYVGNQEKSIGAWQIEVPDRSVLGVPNAEEAQARAGTLVRAFSYLPLRHNANDWLEGHLALHRTLVGPKDERT